MIAHLKRINNQHTRGKQEGANGVEVEMGLNNSIEVSCILVSFFEPIYSGSLFEVHFLNFPQEVPSLEC